MNELAVIFDMDGVLVDSYQAHFRSWQLLAEEMGIADFTEEQFARTFGKTSREILRKHWPIELSDEQIRRADDHKEELYRKLIREDFREIPGARELVRALHAAGFRLAVGSSGPKANVDAGLDGLGHREYFDALVSGQDVTHGKPDPEIFLVAGRRLGVAAGRCAVIEDAPAGIEAARRAGMTPVAITGTAAREDLAAAGAKSVVDSLTELTPQRIAELIAGG